jgi:hypothetical protein
MKVDKEALEAANRVQHFLDMLEAKPIKLADEFYSIHVGTEWEAEMRLSDLRKITAALHAAFLAKGARG